MTTGTAILPDLSGRGQNAPASQVRQSFTALCCGGHGSSADLSHTLKCMQEHNLACVLCGIRFSFDVRSAPSPAGGSECLYAIACRERQGRRAA